MSICKKCGTKYFSKECPKCTNDKKYINASKIGEKYGIKAYELNRILEKLKWIEKDEKGWKLTKQGEEVGGKQNNFKGKLSVSWSEDVLSNKELIKELKALKDKEEKKEEKQTNKIKYEEKIKKGVEYEKYVGKYFEDKGYIVKFNGIEKGKKDNSVDIIAIKQNEIIFIQCKNWNKNSGYKISHKDIKAFLGDIYILIIENKNYQGYKEKRLFVASEEIFDKSAVNYCKEHKDIVRYMHLPIE